MKKIYLAVIFICVAFLAMNFRFDEPKTTGDEHGFKGNCAMCHKQDKLGKQSEIWKETKHSKAYKTLTTEASNAIAKAKGLTKPAAESPECLQCHASGYDVAEAMKDKKFDYKDGVQCETCHGAAADYVSLHNKEGKLEEAKAKGLRVLEADKIEEFCKTCHNEKSPSFKEFKFAEMWDKIKHPLPVKK